MRLRGLHAWQRVVDRAARFRSYLRAQPARIRAYLRSPRGRRHLVFLALATLLVGLALALALDARGTIRVVNATHDPVRLVVDGKTTYLVPSSSIETPNAGLSFRAFPGSHELVSFAPNGERLATLIARPRAYGQLLAIVAATDQCFFIERNTYGRAKRTGPLRVVIPPGPRVVSVPDDVDAWFSPNPEPSESDRYSSGGERVAIRQNRCPDETEAPTEDR